MVRARKSEERVGAREREDVLRGANEYGAGEAAPRERQARPDFLTSFPVIDDPGDADYGAAPRNARRNGAARLRFHIDGNIEMKRASMVGRVGAEGQQRNTYGIKGCPREAVELQPHSSSVQVAIAGNAFHPAHPMQRALRLILGGLASVFCVIETMLEVTRRPLTPATERLDALSQLRTGSH